VKFRTRTSGDTTVSPEAPNLEQQAAFFRTFGALKVSGLFAPEIAMISEGFEEVFRDHPSDAVNSQYSLHRVISPEYDTPRRQITKEFIERNPKLAWLRDDARVTDLAAALLGPCAYTGSAGNLFNSYINWHSDYFRSAVPPELHVKLAFYLDDLDAGSGALRVMPGTNYPGPFRSSVYDEGREAEFGDLEQRFGLAQEELPCWAIAVHPGDVVVINDSILHANFNGGARRRMFSLQFVQAPRTE
jgi:ectoine hydroxylase-related dioxygenase (phytanoyl-CoA dioxygenase family)